MSTALGELPKEYCDPYTRKSENTEQCQGAWWAADIPETTPVPGTRGSLCCQASMWVMLSLLPLRLKEFPSLSYFIFCPALFSTFALPESVNSESALAFLFQCLHRFSEDMAFKNKDHLELSRGEEMLCGRILSLHLTFPKFIFYY